MDEGKRIATGPLAPRNDNIIDVPVHQQRSLATVTAEIRAYQDAARRMAITYCIEVGRRLVEAKSMVAHGEWGTYLRKELGYSQSRANDLMRIFEAYAADQMRLDGDNLKSQAFGKLSYTQALALLALPSEEEREAFVESHDMSAMSTRELQEELRRRGEGRQIAGATDEDGVTREELEGRLDDALEEIREQGIELAHQKELMASHQVQSKTLEDQLTKVRGERDVAEMNRQRAEKTAKKAAEDLEALQKALDAEKKNAAALQKKLEKAVKNPTVPEATLEKLRREAQEAAQAAQKADGEALAKAKEERARAEIELDKARREAKEAADKVTAMQKELALAAPELAVFRARFERVQAELSALVESVATLPEDKRPGARRGLAALLQKANEQIGGGEDA